MGTISTDPIGFSAGDANLYRYVGNHGTYASDPSGLDEVRVVGGRAYWYSNGIESAFGTSSTADVMLEIGIVGSGDLIHLSDDFGGRRVTTQHLSRQLSDARLAIESDRAASKSDPDAYLAALTGFVMTTLQSASDSDSVVIQKREAEARAAARVRRQVARSTINVQYADGSTGTLVRGTDPIVLEQLVGNRGLSTETMHRTGEPWRAGPQSMKASDVELATRYARALSWEEFDPIDVLQTGLAAVGLVPAIGLPFDLLNGSISAARGDWVGASLSFAAAIPALGYSANASQLAKWGDELYDATSYTMQLED